MSSSSSPPAGTVTGGRLLQGGRGGGEQLVLLVQEVTLGRGQTLTVKHEHAIDIFGYLYLPYDNTEYLDDDLIATICRFMCVV